MNEHQSKEWGVFPRYVSWLTIVLAVLALGTGIATYTPDQHYYPMGGGVREYSSVSGGAVAPTSPGVPMMDSGVTSAPNQGKDMSMYYPYPYPTEVPITDTREFLKVYYNASLLTRDVQVLTRRVETTVRGYDGRIDHESIAPKYGYVSFSVPQSKYDAFRNEIESFVDSRFLTISISSQNLLSQKVSIEEQQKQADTTLANYKTARQKLVATHTNLVQTLQAQVDATSTTENEKIALRQQIANEKASFAVQVSNADANITYAQDWVKAVQTQDQTLLANAATVTGTISVQWISLWDSALLYLPGYWIPSIFGVLAVLSFLHDRRRSRALVL